ncbi:MAG TPA: SRPBCC domain-containing protein [Candidatus Binatia bacterium]|nr:SRPBCC domain-containing protein [Candidatus Binatia bacterium]
MNPGQDHVATVTLAIHAPVAKVWAALTDPMLIQRYFHDTGVTTSWEVGSTITWEGTWKGQPYQDRGTVLAFEPPWRLSTTHWSPLGGTEDRPENYHTVTYELSEAGGVTTLTLRQTNNPSQEAAEAMAQNGWLPILEGLRTLVEG